MLKEAIEKILSLAPAGLLSINSEGITRIYASGNIIPVKDPYKDCAEVTTLTGFVGLLKANVNGFDKAKCFIQVNDHHHVSIETLDCDKWGGRQMHAQAKIMQVESFKFGQFMQQEPFIIGLQAMFVDSPEREELLKSVSTITQEAVTISEDDCVSQKTTNRAGVALVKQEIVKRTVKLRPYRTFREIEQPESNFVFRVRGEGDEPPTCALFEADGGVWRMVAMQSIKTWIESETTGFTVIA